MSGSCCPNLCPECGLVHHNATVEGCLRRQVADLRADVAKAEAERDRYSEMFDAAKKVIVEAEAQIPGEWVSLAGAIAELKAKLAKYTGPLTDEQASFVASAVEYPITPHGMRCIDAAIRRVRKEQK